MPGRPLQPSPSLGDTTSGPPVGSVWAGAGSEFADSIVARAIDAGLAHQLTWATVARILSNLPDDDNPCPHCGGLLQRWSSEPSDCAWRCQACGRLHIPVFDGGRPNREQAAEIGRQARESWSVVEARITARSERPEAAVGEVA